MARRRYSRDRGRDGFTEPSDWEEPVRYRDHPDWEDLGYEALGSGHASSRYRQKRSHDSRGRSARRASRRGWGSSSGE
jgi:hypothetical protein